MDGLVGFHCLLVVFGLVEGFVEDEIGFGLGAFVKVGRRPQAFGAVDPFLEAGDAVLIEAVQEDGRIVCPS